MRKITIAGLLVAATAIGMLSWPSDGVAQEAASTDTVTVGARRKVEVAPDIGILTLGVRSRAETADQAADELSRNARRVIGALEDLGFSDEEIDTRDIRLDRGCVQRCRGRDAEPVIRYLGSASVRLTTSAIDRLGEAIDAGIQAGASGIRGVAFDVSDKSAAEKEALRRAFDFAREKARVLADASGRTLGRTLVIEEGNTRAPRAAVFDAAFATAGAGGGSAGSAPFPIEPPMLQASGEVTVTFQLQ